MNKKILKNVLVVLLIIIIISTSTGCLDDEAPDEVQSLEATITLEDNPNAYYNIRARNIGDDDFDFSFRGFDREGNEQIMMWNQEDIAFYYFSDSEEYHRAYGDAWLKTTGTFGMEEAIPLWELIEGMTEDILKEGTDDFTITEDDPDTGQEVTFFVSNIEVNNDIPDNEFQPPDHVEIIEPVPGPT